MFTDHQGSVRDVTDNTGALVDHIFYDSYGNPEGDDPNGPKHLRLCRLLRRHSHGLLLHGPPHLRATNRRLPAARPDLPGSEPNPYPYVNNSPTNWTRPSGLAAYDPAAANWHHLLDQAVFDEAFLTKYGLKDAVKIHSSEYGWIVQSGEHTGKGGIHPEGWSQAWKDWIKRLEEKGVKITKELIRCPTGEDEAGLWVGGKGVRGWGRFRNLGWKVRGGRSEARGRSSEVEGE